MRLYGKPAFIRLDNGAEFTAAPVMRWLRDASIGSAFIVPESRWQNGFVESFNGKLRGKLLNREWFRRALIVTNLQPQSVVLGWSPIISTCDSLLNWLQSSAAGHEHLPASGISRKKFIR